MFYLRMGWDGTGWDGMDGYEKWLLIFFFNLRYIKHYTHIYLNIYIKVVRTSFLWALNFGHVGGPDEKNQKQPLGRFLYIILKVDLQILPSLRGLFAKYSQTLIFLGPLSFKGISFIKLKCINFLMSFILKGISNLKLKCIEIDFFYFESDFFHTIEVDY